MSDDGYTYTNDFRIEKDGFGQYRAHRKVTYQTGFFTKKEKVCWEYISGSTAMKRLETLLSVKYLLEQEKKQKVPPQYEYFSGDKIDQLIAEEQANANLDN